MDDLDWIDFESEWIAGGAFDPNGEAIYVRFKSGGGWRYDACPLSLWEEFSDPAVSKGQFLNAELRHKPGEKFE